MYIITGGAGFIGSQLVSALNERGITDIIVVDAIGKGDERYKNLCDLRIADYFDRDEFRTLISSGKLPGGITAILHQGACSDTMETDGRYMLDNNFTFSKAVLHYALDNRIPLVYASSAATYGGGSTFRESPEFEKPLNVYGYSKLVFDQYVRRFLPSAESTVVGLRYFNVYGPREHYKGKMASMVYQLHRQLRETGVARLFTGTDGYGDGEQRRDFVFVGDVVKVNLHFAEGQMRKGIVNCGTGESRSFNDIARTIISILGKGKIEYVPMPESIRGKYQSFTQADISSLRSLVYNEPFSSLEDGIAQCIEYWNA
ncbi:MAG: ADP-glyceromanno-heptose 6-epimerase [Armatimonadota bacterium]|nr:ADP-glyceromanno-heptose 6-epimerase [bacterium]